MRHDRVNALNVALNMYTDNRMRSTDIAVMTLLLTLDICCTKLWCFYLYFSAGIFIFLSNTFNSLVVMMTQVSILKK